MQVRNAEKLKTAWQISQWEGREGGAYTAEVDVVDSTGWHDLLVSCGRVFTGQLAGDGIALCLHIHSQVSRFAIHMDHHIPVDVILKVRREWQRQLLTINAHKYTHPTMTDRRLMTYDYLRETLLKSVRIDWQDGTDKNQFRSSNLINSFWYHWPSDCALTLLVGRQERHPASKKTECWGAGVVICLEWTADLHMASWCHCYSLSLASVTSRLVLPSGTGSPG